MSKLYVVATPIGNLEDLSPRALRVLKEANLILAEDTRVTRKLLNAYGIKTPLESCHEHNEAYKSERIISRMAEENLVIALVTDAGTPGISDPGAKVVKAVSEAGFEVLSVPGPSAFAAALSVSGFEEGEFTFFGFLPRKKGELREKLKSMAGHTQLAVVHESPHRIIALMEAVAEVYPGIRVSVSCDLTKLYEKTLWGSVEAVLKALKENEKTAKGEYCVVLRLADAAGEKKPAPIAMSLEVRLMEEMLSGRDIWAAMAALVESGEKKNQVYAASLRLKEAARQLKD
ncbi:MAG: 16S rRNA (cytidine(1402)-2'-O)-methyltransferase [Christensenellales bacterium]|jgi:16S rRNA (cytidine1402-2'-O)-methyltransferase